MRVIGFLVILTVFASPLQAHANARSWAWWPQNWQDMNFEPHIGAQKILQRSVWDSDTWTPEQWINTPGDEKRIIHNFYKTHLITNQYTDGDNIPVLEVGPPFIQLSRLDRRRVLQFVDYVFNITAAEKDGMFYVLYAENRREPLGIYNRYGFQSY